MPPEVEISTYENWVEWQEKLWSSQELKLPLVHEEDASNPEGTVHSVHVHVLAYCTVTDLYSF